MENYSFEYIWEGSNIMEELTKKCFIFYPMFYCKDTYIHGYKECSYALGYDRCDIIFTYPLHIICIFLILCLPLITMVLK